MFREFIEVNDVRETKKVESIFPKFFDDIQLDGAREIKEVYESKIAVITLMKRIQYSQRSLRI